ncbi:MAG: flagellar basal-body MS-ring/collar protein FliF [Gammaproteobacteria bacterium]|nr:flagellar basal-body MS-ring/collar protein FliF [Gammaproteobacteria bacterium]
MATTTGDAAARSSGAGEGARSGMSGRRITDSMSSEFLTGFMRLDLVRQFGLMVGLAASVALGFAVVLWSRGEEYQPLYADMNGYDMNQLVEVLETGSAEYRVDPATGVILVPAAQVSTLRLQVAAAGITREAGYGYEALDLEQGLGTSQFMEANRYKRSQEGELQRTIMGFRNVQAARVHLATPERSVFVRSSRKPTASVFLTLMSGSDLSDTQVDAIANLVASSVPELTPENVTIVDQRGNLLSRKDDKSDLVIAGEQFDYARRYEDALVERVSRMLQPLVGAGRFTAEISADIDFTRTEQAAETYNPDGILRSEQSLQERRDSAEVNGGIPGALSNQPPVDGLVQDPLLADGALADPAAAGNAAAGAGNTREQATRNYELDRTISYTNYDPVSVRRLSVAVMLDDRPALAAAAGEPATEAWTPEELERITAVVRDVVGYSAERGDSVTVINNRFAPLVIEEIGAEPFWQQDWLLSTVKQVGGLLLVFVLVFSVLRPVLRNLAALGNQSKDMARVAGGGEFADLDIDGKPVANDKVTLSGGDDILLPSPDDGYERQLNAIKGLVAQDPGRVAQVVKQWINDDA